MKRINRESAILPKRNTLCLTKADILQKILRINIRDAKYKETDERK